MSELKIGSLFSGIGGLDLAVEAFFHAETVWHCEFDPEPSKVLAARWPGVPNLGDITTVDWSTVEPVDIVCGGSPCQDVSAAGRRAGMVEGTRSNLWVAMREAIAVLKPSIVIWENVRGALSAYAYSEMESEPGLLGESYGPDRPALRAAGRVVGDLSDLGYDTQWVTLPASAVGAPHRRERVFVLAHAANIGLEWARSSRERGSRSENCRHGHTDMKHDDVVFELSPETALGGRSSVRKQRIEWGDYTTAVRRWEAVLGRPAPDPTKPDGKNGNHRLNAEFCSWMMGYALGWVTDILTRNPAIRACGNGVVPQQAYAALEVMWPRVIEALEAA